MTSQNHIIQKQIFDLALDDSTGSFHLQTDISRIFHGKVAPFIDACCDQLSDPKKTHRIDRLEVDIGKIHINNLEEELVQKIKSILSDELAKNIQQMDSNETEAVDNQKHQRKLKLITCFIQSGTLPWWANHKDRDIEAVFEYGMIHLPEDVHNIIKSSMQNTRQLERIIYQFSDNILFKIIQCLMPDSDKRISAFCHDLKEVLKKTPATAKVSKSTFKRELWMGIFSLINSKQNMSLQTDMASPILLHMAEILGIDYYQLLKNTSDAVKRLKKSGYRFQTKLPEILDQSYMSAQRCPGKPHKPVDSGLIKTKISRLKKRTFSNIEYQVLTFSQALLKSFDKISNPNDDAHSTQQKQMEMFAVEMQFKISEFIRLNKESMAENLQVSLKNISQMLTQYEYENKHEHLKNNFNGLISASISPDFQNDDSFVETGSDVRQEQDLKLSVNKFPYGYKRRYPKNDTNELISVPIPLDFHKGDSFVETGNDVRQEQDLKLSVHEFLYGDKRRYPKNDTNELISATIPADFHNDDSFAETGNKVKQKQDLELSINEVTYCKSPETPLGKIKTAIETLIKNQRNKSHKITEQKHDIGMHSQFLAEQEGIYINNSGIILLWPYLSRFFQTIGLTKENEFIDNHSAKRGALILQYLSDGSIEMPEYILLLNKILCGIDPEEPMEASLDITELEKSECEKLLLTVIQHWGTLKQTSSNGLQRAFIQRNGVLKTREGGWLLQVEKQTHDILLEKLPWSISAIKLPWMDNILFVEW